MTAFRPGASPPPVEIAIRWIPVELVIALLLCLASR
jgi:hypothetical protein